MRSRQAVFVGLLVVAGVTAALVPVAGVVTDEPTPAAMAGQADNGSATPSMGAQLSSFMAAQSAEANGSVDSGMWDAKFNESDDEARTVRARTATLEQRLDRLETQLDGLEARREAGDLNEAAYLARASQLTARIDTLQQSIDRTESAAAGAGVNTTELSRLREAAGDASGRAVARTARNLSVVNPSARGQAPGNGPPGDAGRPTETGQPADTGQPAGDSPSETADQQNATDAGGQPGNGPADGGASGGPGPADGSGRANDGDQAGNGNGGSAGSDDGGQADDGSSGQSGPDDGSQAGDSGAGQFEEGDGGQSENSGGGAGDSSSGGGASDNPGGGSGPSGP